jgi:hypothetical protein
LFLITVHSIATLRCKLKSLELIMNRTYNILSRTESAAVAVGASLFSIVTVGAVIALFATTTPEEAPLERIVLDTVVITAAKTV